MQINVSSHVSQIKTEIKERPVVFGSIGILLLFLLIGASFPLFMSRENPSQDTPTQQNQQIQQNVVGSEQLQIGYFTPPVNKTGWTWRIHLRNNNNTNVLTLDDMEKIEEIITPDTRGDALSPYTLMVKDASGAALLTTKVGINKIPIMEDLSNPERSIPTPESTRTQLYIPYQENASTIEISENGTVVLQFPIPAEALGALIKEGAVAQTFQAACKPVQIVFINDGYPASQFHQDIENLKSSFAKFAPYNASEFDYQIIDNQENLGCSRSIPDCLDNPRLKEIVTQRYPEFTKIMILARNIPFIGMANRVGGDVTFATQGSESYELFMIAGTHEMLGHALGALQDRYLYGTDPGRNDYYYDEVKNRQIPASNCSANPQGEASWDKVKHFFQGQGFQGCGSNKLYAPYPLNCSHPQAGPRDSLMGNCPDTNDKSFDPVETAWITNNILPLYACGRIDPVVTGPVGNDSPGNNQPDNSAPTGAALQPAPPDDSANNNNQNNIPPQAPQSCSGGTFQCSGVSISCSSLTPVNGSCDQAQRQACPGGNMFGAICGNL